ncbi:hypothetical protein IU501_30560 [Nocardia otitidiscaviarum]|uniref:hypothetical protein n=1 Tax=Nocardia otitidiscaviarum TaxID=1823 RepID=UPI0004A7275A|nr:hypothetical protein [Nocardia otitidiscaviarum]MBF6137321.1 hypothetical protein [Nocardia otitidiscaviarum]
MGHSITALIVPGTLLHSVSTINAALRAFGVTAAPGSDEFDTVGLADHRSSPDYLDRYIDLCDDMGV